MNKNIKYYRVILNNPFEELDLNQEAIVVVSNNENRELLTNKKVYLYSDNLDCLEKNIVLDDFSNKKCELIGGNFEELNEEFVLKFLKFTPRVDIDNMVNNIINIEESLRNYIENNQNKEIKTKK